MEGKSLYDFYERVVLPQFGVEGAVLWHRSELVGPDETAHYFSVGKQGYILIFEDYCMLGKDPLYIREHVTTEKYRFVQPVSKTYDPPSWGFRLLAPYHYCANVTGTFTLLAVE